MVAVTYTSYCPMSNLDAVSKTFIKTYLLAAALSIYATLVYSIILRQQFSTFSDPVLEDYHY